MNNIHDLLKELCEVDPNNFRWNDMGLAFKRPDWHLWFHEPCISWQIAGWMLSSMQERVAWGTAQSKIRGWHLAGEGKVLHDCLSTPAQFATPLKIVEWYIAWKKAKVRI